MLVRERFRNGGGVTRGIRKRRRRCAGFSEVGTPACGRIGNVASISRVLQKWWRRYASNSETQEALREGFRRKRADYLPNSSLTALQLCEQAGKQHRVTYDERSCCVRACVTARNTPTMSMVTVDAACLRDLSGWGGVTHGARATCGGRLACCGPRARGGRLGHRACQPQSLNALRAYGVLRSPSARSSPERAEGAWGAATASRPHLSAGRAVPPASRPTSPSPQKRRTRRSALTAPSPKAPRGAYAGSAPLLIPGHHARRRIGGALAFPSS